MNIIVHGCTGRMGTMLLSLIADSAHTLAAGISPSAAGEGRYAALADYTGPADCVIDFSNHSATAELTACCARRGLPLVIATTAQTEEDMVHIRAAAEVIPQAEAILRDPNNVLAIEYIKAARALNADLDLFAVERAISHNADAPEGNIASAKFIRNAIRTQNSPSTYASYLPKNVLDTLERQLRLGNGPSDRTKFSVAAMARLMTVTAEDLLQINGVKQGLENRILHCMHEASDLYTLFDLVKTKRFTHARIRQILISAVLGVKREALERENPYIRVLGMNNNGRALLRSFAEHASVPLIMNLSEAPECEERVLDERSGRLFDICRPVPLQKNPEYAIKPYVSG